MAELPIAPVLRKGTLDVVLRPTLGFTAYLANPEFWANGGAQGVLDRLLPQAPAQLLTLGTTSHLTHWQRLGARELSEYRNALDAGASHDGHPRHGFQLKLADCANCPAVGFSYSEVDPGRADRASTLEISLPMMTDPAALLELAQAVFDLGPVYSLVGGFTARWNCVHARLAFHRFHRWSFRYLGLDIQEPDEAA